MSWTKNDKLICDECGLFCVPYDEYTPFGSKDYENPEPLDPYHVCKKCWPALKREWLERLRINKTAGDWQKSRAEEEAAKELGLVYIHSDGVGTLGSKDFADPYRYIPQAEYDRLEALPYWGHCKKCGVVRKGGYCSDDSCSEFYKQKISIKYQSLNS